MLEQAGLFTGLMQSERASNFEQSMTIHLRLVYLVRVTGKEDGEQSDFLVHLPSGAPVFAPVSSRRQFSFDIAETEFLTWYVADISGPAYIVLGLILLWVLIITRCMTANISAIPVITFDCAIFTV